MTTSTFSSTASSLSTLSTSSSASAGPSLCVLPFDIQGTEDIEVGDDSELDPLAETVDCVPYIGAGGATVGCGALASPPATSVVPPIATVTDIVVRI